MKKSNREYETTTNSSVYKKLRKRYLEGNSKGVRCAHCKYHRGENDTYNHYFHSEKIKHDIIAIDIESGEEIPKYSRASSEFNITWTWKKVNPRLIIKDKQPSWKLTSKNRKQWMDKKIKKVYDYRLMNNVPYPYESYYEYLNDRVNKNWW